MEKYILDTHAVFVLLNKEKGFQKVKALLEDNGKENKEVYLSLLSLGEIYYILIREVGEEKATNIITKIENLSLNIMKPDTLLTKEAAKIKATGGLSYADSFVIATAVHLGAKIVTGDPEFKKFTKMVEIVWI